MQETDIENKMNIIEEKNEPVSFLQGIKDCIPTLIGYISIGFAAGVVGVSSNLSILEVALLSVFVYAGSAQFIICALFAVGTPISAIIFTTFIVNFRHLLLSMTVAPAFTRYSIIKNVGFGILLTDETFGVVSNKIARHESVNDKWMNGLNITAYGCWIIACTLGAIFGKWIDNFEAFGIDFALPAMFIALLVLQLQSQQKSKLKLYFSLILYVVLFMLILSTFMPSYIAILLSTIIVATIGVLKDR